MPSSSSSSSSYCYYPKSAYFFISPSRKRKISESSIQNTLNKDILIFIGHSFRLDRPTDGQSDNRLQTINIGCVVSPLHFLNAALCRLTLTFKCNFYFYYKYKTKNRYMHVSDDIVSINSLLVISTKS